ncbi:uncharacterized protein EI90DRAFT_3125510 [Cantharellus anzutake]|uniref:uncharacterized protein n=1 Tax=Cantharellus anzutake TaxID=1750568 RepID=UPI001904814A|nr:uncharacterized protein EI90DRAFT_3125510 [Cantharellus anzutake]KAF8329172.1 hypothetical protein EI90DRAFT_3125510 [Cantharellus anzutake]
MAKATAHRVDRLKKEAGEYTVRDPISGKDVIIKDAQLSDYDNDALDPAHLTPGPALHPGAAVAQAGRGCWRRGDKARG